MQQQQPPDTRQGKPGANRADTKSRDSGKQETDERTEITTSIFNKIDLLVDGIPQEALLKDEILMRNITERHCKTVSRFSNAVHPWRFEQGGHGLQQRVSRSHLQHGERGADRVEANHRYSPMPSLLETDPTRNAAVSMWKLASTRRAHDQPDQEQIRRTLQTELQSRNKQITRNETRTSSLAAITLEMTLCVQRCLQKTARNTMKSGSYLTDGTKMNDTE